MGRPTATLVEVFSSFQGEGLLVGVRQVFARFHGCNLDCAYCDTPQGRGSPPTMWTIADSQDEVPHSNPAAPEELTTVVERFDRRLHHSIAVTGGEPLLQAEFLHEWLPAVKQAEWDVYLETNGTLPDALESILPWVDWAAADIKIGPRGLAVDTGLVSEFLRLLKGRQAFAKAIVGKGWGIEGVEAAARLCADAALPLVIQPAASVPNGPASPSPSEIYSAHDAASRFLPNVRVIPQAHKVSGVP